MNIDASECSSPTCPSQAVLDAFELEELEDVQLRIHIETCERCQRRLAERREAFSAIRGRDELIRAIHVAVAGSRPEQNAAPFRKRQTWRFVGLAAIAASAALAFLTVVPVGPELTETTRAKGSIGLSVYVERSGRATRANSGEQFRPGERIRFEVDLPRGGEVMIVGQEASGRVYNAFPAGTGIVESQAFRTGVDQLLPGAVALDASLGRETLYLIRCARSFDSTQIQIKAARVEAPQGCLTARFVLFKVDP